MSLWTNDGAKQIVKELWPEDSTDDLKLMEETFKEFARYDRVSSSFRYPNDTKGNPSIDKGIEMINIWHFAEQIKGAVELLEGVTWGIADFEDHKNDMIQDSMGYWMRQPQQNV